MNPKVIGSYTFNCFAMCKARSGCWHHFLNKKFSIILLLHFQSTLLSYVLKVAMMSGLDRSYIIGHKMGHLKMLFSIWLMNLRPWVVHCVNRATTASPCWNSNLGQFKYQTTLRKTYLYFKMLMVMINHNTHRQYSDISTHTCTKQMPHAKFQWSDSGFPHRPPGPDILGAQNQKE